MAEQRLIDANALLDKQESLYMKGHVLFHGVTAYAIENAPTIDPETLPVVQQLRAELAEVKAERDGYKAFYDNITACGDCNDCGIAKTCKYKPMAGETTRFNCHLWKAVSTND